MPDVCDLILEPLSTNPDNKLKEEIILWILLVKKWKLWQFLTTEKLYDKKPG